MRIERKKVSSLVLDELKKMIKSGELSPNSKLPTEMELVKKFGVSRGPLREALTVLEASGIIESRQGGGSWIREINLANMLESVQFEMVDIQEIHNLLEMRTIIESEAAYLAAERHKETDLRELLVSLQAFSKIVEDANEVGYEADYAFHHILVRSAYNPFLSETLNHLSELHLKAVKFSLQKDLGKRRKKKEVYLEHVKIYEAVKNRDSAAAKEAVISHLTNVRLKLGDERIVKNKL